MLLLLLLFLGLSASPALLRGAPADIPPTPRPEASYPEEPEADRVPFLHLRRGALIESIAFSAAYLRAAPHEDCVVLPSPPGTRLGGVAVYTKAGRLWLRSVTFGVVPLPGLSAADINDREKIIAAIAAVPRGRRSDPADAAESDEAQLRKAALAVSFFPSALSEAVLASPDGGAAARKTRVLVLDWNQHHYLWSPKAGVIDVPVPVDPLTHAPFLCVPEPELPGSVLFAAEYSRLHPEERAEVLLDPRMTSHPRAWFARGAAVAAYTEGERVSLHTGSENLPLPGATRADFGDLAKLTAVALDRYHRFLEERGERPGPVPNGLIGDTRELQLKRAHFRLQIANARPGRTRQGENLLVIDCGCLQCAYAPGHGAAYSGWLPPYQALLVDGIVFAGEYLRTHPGEKAVVVAHPPAGRLTYPAGGINAHVFYTRQGALWGHLAEDHVGEYRIEGERAAAIADRARLVDLCSRNPSGQDALARATPSLLGDPYHQSVAGPPDLEAEPFGAKAVLAQLRAQGVPCRLVPERERAEDGRVTEYPAPAVVFRWAGEAFVYSRQKIYRALARGYPPDLALD